MFQNTGVWTRVGAMQARIPEKEVRRRELRVHAMK